MSIRFFTVSRLLFKYKKFTMSIICTNDSIEAPVEGRFDGFALTSNV